MIERIIAKTLQDLTKKFPVVFLTGPRQSGKTTLLRYLFPESQYISLEDPETALLAEHDPKSLLGNLTSLMIIDEAQKAPQLFSYIQGIVDQHNRPGMFILSGSQSFLLLEKISQTLAGRTAVLNLLPFSLSELTDINYNQTSFYHFIFNGFFPRPLVFNINPSEFFPSYLMTYVERDVRSVKNIFNLRTFQLFIKLCAGRIGQSLNLNSLANDCGISTSTARSWISLLEASYIIYLHRPYYKSFNKRIIKMPKLYFIDTGLACSLLEIQSESQLTNHYLRGHLFENFVIIEFLKYYYNIGLRAPLYFWRDSTGNEIDLIIDNSDKLMCIEIKSGQTITSEYFKEAKSLIKLKESGATKPIVIYGGENNFEINDGRFISWKGMAKADFFINLLEQ